MRRKRVIKAPLVRRAELIDAALRLFLDKGYDVTTINDVIAATGLSKGAFYHHFKAKEDLLEAVTERIVTNAVAGITIATQSESLGTMERMYLLFEKMRMWKIDNMAQLRAMFTSMLVPENAALYFRICQATISALAPLLADIIEQGKREDVFDVPNALIAAESMLWMAIARRSTIAQALNRAFAGHVDAATDMIVFRLRAEGLMLDRMLGAPDGSIDLIGPIQDLKKMITLWCQSGDATDDKAKICTFTSRTSHWQAN